MFKGYHEVPEEDSNKITPAFQITDRSETTDKIIPPRHKSPSHNSSPKPMFPPHFEKGESTQEQRNETITEVGLFAQAMDYLNVDFKFLTIVILLISIGAVVVIFPRVNFYYHIKHSAGV